MNISNQMRTISSSWLFSGVALMIWSTIELWQIGNNLYLGIGSGAFQTTLESLAVSCTCILGAYGLMKRKQWGRILIILTSSLMTLYAAAYLLMGGFEDTGPIYAVAVFGLFLLSIVTFAIAARKNKFKEWQLNNGIEATGD
jgi:hypothetical protein